MKIAIVLVSSFFIGAFSAPAEDLVANLPGLNFRPNFQHYSGYLQASTYHYFHYWFTMSQNNRPSDPVLLWLNGGPGCSSLGGLMDELGPFHAMDYGNTIYENVYAWNKVGHVLFMESPSAVGYSYTTNGNVTTGDDEVARDNYNALLYFFRFKFPELNGSDFYITGESYAGVYLPTLGVLLAQDKTNFPNFKGMAIGNGILHFPLNYNTLVPFLYNHMLTRQSLWDSVSRQCCNNNPTTCDYYGYLFTTGACTDQIIEMYRPQDLLDPYNLYASCYLPENKRRAILSTILRRGRISPSEFLSRDVPVCAQENSTEVYMNRADVRGALHIPSFLPRWTDCNMQVNNVYQVQYDHMIQQVNTVVNAGVRVLIYNGDVDSVCNGVMNQQFLSLLNRTVTGSLPDRSQPWHYALNVPNIAGFVTRFSGGIDFVTVRGAGHFVPTDRAREALQMIYNFVNNRDYSLATGINVNPQPIIG